MDSQTGKRSGQGPIIEMEADAVTKATPATPGESLSEAAEAGKYGPRATVRYFDMALAWAKRMFSPPRFDFVAHWSVRLGHYALLLAQVLSLVIGLAAAIKFSSWDYLLAGIGSAVLLLVLQYTASRFLNAGDALIRSSPSRLGSIAFLDCLALLLFALGVYLLVQNIMLKDWTAFFWGLGIFALCDALAYVALNPPMANTSIIQGLSAGEEAIGILSFMVKQIVAIIPIVFGVGAVIGAVAIAVSLYPLFKDSQAMDSFSAIRITLICACLPFAGYVFFVLYHLGLDLMRAVLSVPGKLDALAKRRE